MIEEEEEVETSERRKGVSNIDRGSYVGVWLALCEFDRDGNVNGDWELSSPEPAARRACVGTLLLLLLPWRSYRPASAHATVDVLLFLLRWL